MALPKGITIVNAPKPGAPAGTTNYDDKVRAANAEATAKANQGTKGFDVDWKQLGMMVGGGMLAHSLASSLMNNKSDEEKRRESIWERLLSVVIPIGAMGLGAWGGKYLHSKMAAADEGTGFVFDDEPAKTNSFYQISSNLPLAKALFEDVANRAGEGEEPLSHRMREAAKDMYPDTEQAANDASKSALRWYTGFAPSLAATGYAGWKWRNYANQNRRFNAAQSIIDQDEAYNAAIEKYKESVNKHNIEVAKLEQEKEQQLSYEDAAVKRQMGKKPSSRAARIQTEAEAKRNSIQKQIDELNKKIPESPTVKAVRPGVLTDAENTRKSFVEKGLADPGAKKVQQLPRRVAKASTIGGGMLSGALLYNAIRNHRIANEQSQRAEGLERLINMMPKAVVKTSN
jgi:hypothetical protein